MFKKGLCIAYTVFAIAFMGLTIRGHTNEVDNFDKSQIRVISGVVESVSSSDDYYVVSVSIPEKTVKVTVDYKPSVGDDIEVYAYDGIYESSEFALIEEASDGTKMIISISLMFLSCVVVWLAYGTSIGKVVW